MNTSLLAVDDGLINGNLNAADLFFLIAAVLFGVVTFMHFTARTVEAALTTLGFCVVAVGLLIL